MRYLVALLVFGLGGCLDTRDRLQPPRVYLYVDETSVAPGGEIFGRVSAADSDGIIYIAAQLVIDGDTARPQRSFAGDFQGDTVDFAFSFTVKHGFPSGTQLFISATVRDEQNFEVTRSDTSLIR